MGTFLCFLSLAHSSSTDPNEDPETGEEGEVDEGARVNTSKKTRETCVVPVSIELGKFLPLCGIALVAHHQILDVIDVHVIRLESLVQRVYKLRQGENLPKFLPVLGEARRFLAKHVEQSILPVANLHFPAEMYYQHCIAQYRALA